MKLGIRNEIWYQVCNICFLLFRKSNLILWKTFSVWPLTCKRILNVDIFCFMNHGKCEHRYIICYSLPATNLVKYESESTNVYCVPLRERFECFARHIFKIVRWMFNGIDRRNRILNKLEYSTRMNNVKWKVMMRTMKILFCYYNVLFLVRQKTSFREATSFFIRTIL